VNSRVVWKHPLSHYFEEVLVPHGSEVRLVEAVNGVPTVWIERTPEAENQERWIFRVVGTGHGFTALPGQHHIGSARCVSTGRVWHVYRLIDADTTPPEGNANPTEAVA
jgi:hypothetical protein